MQRYRLAATVPWLPTPLHVDNEAQPPADGYAVVGLQAACHLLHRYLAQHILLTDTDLLDVYRCGCGRVWH